LLLVAVAVAEVVRVLAAAVAVCGQQLRQLVAVAV
jgi:hypothetical protein